MAAAHLRAVTYPETRRDDSVVDELHGTKVADPYRWLEDPDAPETQDWVKKQNATFEQFFSQPGDANLRERIKEQLQQMYDYEKYSCPFKRGQRYFYYHNTGLQNQSVLYSQRSLVDPAQVFVNPNEWSADGTASIGTSKFSEDGNFFAYGVSRSGSDWQKIEIKEVETNVVLDERLEWVKFSSIAWTHDNKGFYYCRFPAPASVAEADSSMTEKVGTEGDSALHQRVYYHVLNTPQSADVLVYENDEHPAWLFGVEVTDDGRYLLLSTSESCDPKNLLYLCDLQESTGTDGTPLQIRKLVDEFEAEYSYITNEGTTFYFKTNLNSPRYKVISIDIANPAKEHWKDVLAETTDVLEFVTVVNQTALVAVYLHDAKEELYVFDLSKPSDSGSIADTRVQIALPTLGTISGLSGRKQDTEMFYHFYSFTYPGTIFRYDFSIHASSIFREIRIAEFDPTAFETEQVFYQSKDGTRVPMFIVRPAGFERNGDNMVYLYGYGGFSISLTPTFNAFRCVLMKGTGGAAAIPNLRGGGEYGEDWHHAGTLAKKQNVFDDFIAAAEYLIDHKYTRSDKLAISGGSNGGLLVAACINQRPDLFGSAICQVGVLDMLRFHKFTIGHFWCSDYGCADNAEHFEFLIKYSPLHTVRKGTRFPATLLTTADHDDRVVPLHSFKYIAELQHQIAHEDYQTAPLLIRIEEKAGHGGGKPTTKLLAEVADIYAFLTVSLGVEWRS